MNENLLIQQAPHVRQSETVKTIMRDMIFALLPLYFMAFFYYGVRAFALGIFSVFCTTLCNMVCSLILGRKVTMVDLTPTVTGMILPLMMPATIPYYVVAIADMVAILIVKFPFGGTGENLFNPAAVGFASVALAWPQLLFTYPAVSSKLFVFEENIVKMAPSPSYSLSIGAVPDATLLDILLGNTPGPMGVTNILLVTACGLYIIARKATSWRIPTFFLSVYTILNMLFVRIAAPFYEAMAYETFSGMIVFGAFFMLTEPVTGPKRDTAKCIYAAASAITVFLFHRFGGFEDGFVFALIIMNVFSPLIDLLCENVMHAYRLKNVTKIVLKPKKKTGKNPDSVSVSGKGDGENP